jgi:hypothetical protein
MNDAVSFRIQGDFKVKLGKDQQEFSIPRLKFKDADKVIGIISKAAASSASSALKIAFSSKMAGADATKFNDISGSIDQVLSELMRTQSFITISEIFDAMTYDSIPAEIIAAMDYQEMVDLVTYLVKETFGALKNLSASFEVITMSR